MKRILWISDAPTQPTGYGSVTRNILPKIKGYDIMSLGWAYGGQEYWLGPNLRVDPILDEKSFGFYIDGFKPDLVCLFGSFEHFRKFYPNRGRLWDGWRMLPYITIETPRIPQNMWDILNSDKVPYLATPSNYSKGILEKYGFKVGKVIPHGVDTSLFKPEKYKVSNSFIFGSIHTNTFRKVLPRLILAFKKMYYELDCKDSRLYMACWPSFGEGYDLSDLIKAELGAGKVLFPMWAVYRTNMPSDFMPKVYNAMDVSMCPSSGESFGLPYLEAMATGVPTITTDEGAAREVMGDAALYAKVKDYFQFAEADMALVDIDDLAAKMSTLYRDENSYKSCREKGLERAKEWPWERAVRVMQETFDELLRD